MDENFINSQNVSEFLANACPPRQVTVVELAGGLGKVRVREMSAAEFISLNDHEEIIKADGREDQKYDDTILSKGTAATYATLKKCIVFSIVDENNKRLFTFADVEKMFFDTGKRQLFNALAIAARVITNFSESHAESAEKK
jgi:hypothetical protein